MTIGDKIKDYRKRAGLTQKRLGELSDTSEITIRQYENGKRQPRIEQLKKIAFVLSVPLNTLISDNPLDAGELVKQELIDIIENLEVSVSGIEDTEELTNMTLEILNRKNHYMKIYDKLNETGQIRAIEQVEMLTKIPEYLKENNP